MNIWKRNWKSRISDYITIVDLNVDYIFIILIKNNFINLKHKK